MQEPLEIETITIHKSIKSNLIENLDSLGLIPSSFGEYAKNILITEGKKRHYNPNYKEIITKISLPANIDYFTQGTDFCKNLQRRGLKCKAHLGMGTSFIEIYMNPTLFVAWVEQAVVFQKNWQKIWFEIPTGDKKNLETILSSQPFILVERLIPDIYSVYQRYLQKNDLVILLLQDCVTISRKIREEIADLHKKIAEGNAIDNDSRQDYYSQRSGRSMADRAEEELYLRQLELKTINMLEFLWYAAFPNYFKIKLPSDKTLSILYGKEVRYAKRDRADEILLPLKNSNPPLPETITLFHTAKYLNWLDLYDNEWQKNSTIIHWSEWPEIVRQCQKIRDDKFGEKNEIVQQVTIPVSFFKPVEKIDNQIPLVENIEEKQEIVKKISNPINKSVENSQELLDEKKVQDNKNILQRIMESPISIAEIFKRLSQCNLQELTDFKKLLIQKNTQEESQLLTISRAIAAVQNPAQPQKKQVNSEVLLERDKSILELQHELVTKMLALNRIVLRQLNKQIDLKAKPEINLVKQSMFNQGSPGAGNELSMSMRECSFLVGR